jgi:hypothetical protein
MFVGGFSAERQSVVIWEAAMSAVLTPKGQISHNSNLAAKNLHDALPWRNNNGQGGITTEHLPARSPLADT